MIVRALGPTLSNFGVANALADPTLELRDINGDLIRSNDNWSSTQQAEIIATGLQPSNDAESPHRRHISAKQLHDDCARRE